MTRVPDASPRQLDVAAFLARPLDPLVFYDILPSDGWRLAAPPPAAEVYALIERLAHAALDEISEAELDTIRIALLGGAAVSAPAPALLRLADHASRLYAQLLAGGKRNRPMRMKLQQLNFFLRDVLDRDIETASQILADHPMEQPAPWDWYTHEHGSLLLTSGAENVHWQWRGKAGRQACGFPSQLDDIGDGRISIGSIFSDGAYLFEEGVISPVPHHRPIVLLFLHSSALWAVDYDGCVFPLDSGTPEPFRAPVAQVDRVRRIGRRLFLSDWTRPGEIVVVDLDKMSATVQPMPGVLLLNDICEGPHGFYAICKQQGKVFAFDAGFKPRAERLGFGRGAGRLFDPLSIRCTGDLLQVLNWITGSLISLRAF